MATCHYYTFVLWGENFEEATAAIFVTELRKRGLLVKMVGLNLQRNQGAQGLALMPDLSLGKSLLLASRSMCVIVPSTLPNIGHLKNDPRLLEFFTKAHDNQAKFVLSEQCKTSADDLGLHCVDNILRYPQNEVLVPFARDLAEMLLECASAS